MLYTCNINNSLICRIGLLFWLSSQLSYIFYSMTLDIEIYPTCMIHLQRLEFMRTETEVEKREVLAVWMRGAMSHVGQTEHHGKLASAVKQSGMGKAAEKREFLIAGRADNFISIKFKNSIRRSCTAIFLDKLPPELAKELREGKFPTS